MDRFIIFRSIRSLLPRLDSTLSQESEKILKIERGETLAADDGATREKFMMQMDLVVAR